MSTRVWYASYGSNLSRHRFERYLHGGIPKGGRRRYPGARDRRPPAGDRPVTLPYRLRFGGASRTWGGGMAFVDATTHGHVLARAYQITLEQFADIHAQENGGDADTVDLAAVGAGQRVVAGRGNYPVIIRCGALDGAPMFTFTAAALPASNAPVAAYVRTIATGLAESHRMTTAAIVDYLRAAPAVGASYEPATLATVVAAGVDDAMVAPPTHSGPA